MGMADMRTGMAAMGTGMTDTQATGTARRRAAGTFTGTHTGERRVRGRS